MAVNAMSAASTGMSSATSEGPGGLGTAANVNDYADVAHAVDRKAVAAW